MGQTISTQQISSQQHAKFQFQQIVNDPNFGSLEIYRTIDPPYDYVMNYKKTFLQGNPMENFQEEMKLVAWLEEISEKHDNLVGILSKEIKEEVNMCIRNKNVSVFCKYYNFTFKNAIQTKKKNSSNFTQSELIFVMGRLLDLSVWLKQHNSLAIANYSPEKIYLSREGDIKIYLLDWQKEHMHANYYKALSGISGRSFSCCYLAPEQLKSLQKLDYEIKYDVFKADLFSIGMIMLQAIIQDEASSYYSFSSREGIYGVKVNLARIHFDLETLKGRSSQKFAEDFSGCKQSNFRQENRGSVQYFSSDFIELIRMCLQEDPKRRFSLEQANKFLLGIKAKYDYFCSTLRLNGLKNANKAILTATQIQPEMNSQQQNLNPRGPIQNKRPQFKQNPIDRGSLPMNLTENTLRPDQSILRRNTEVPLNQNYGNKLRSDQNISRRSSDLYQINCQQSRENMSQQIDPIKSRGFR